MVDHLSQASAQRTDLGTFNLLLQMQAIISSQSEIGNPIRYVLMWGKNPQCVLFNIFRI